MGKLRRNVAKGCGLFFGHKGWKEFLLSIFTLECCEKVLAKMFFAKRYEEVLWGQRVMSQTAGYNSGERCRT